MSYENRFAEYNLLPMPVFVVDKDFNVVFLNKKASETYKGNTTGKCYEISHNLSKPCFHYKEHPCPIAELINNKDGSKGVVHRHATSEGNKFFYVHAASLNEDLFLETHIDITGVFNEFGIDNKHIEMLFSYGKTVFFLLKNDGKLTVDFVSNSVYTLTGYAPQEFIDGQLSYIDLIYLGDLVRVREEIDNGSDSAYTNLLYKIIRKDKKVIDVLAQTIPLKNANGEVTHYYTYVMDVTKEVRFEKLYKALRVVNKAITSILNDDKLFETICKVLVDEFGIKFIWIGVPDNESRYFKSIYKYGDEKGYLDAVKIAADNEIPEGRGTTGKAYREGDVFINPYTLTNPDVLPWKDELLSRDFLSSAAVPILKNGRVVAVMNMYASEPYFFEEENKTLLDELKNDLSFAIQKNEEVRKSVLLQKAIEKSKEWVVIAEESGKIIYVNDFVLELSGYKEEEVIGKTPRVFKSGYYSEDFYNSLWRTLLDKKEFNAILVNRKKNGETFYLEEKIVPIEIEGMGLHFLSLGRDITKETILSKENEKLRYYDLLTELYNLNGFSFQAQEHLTNSKPAALAVIDIQGLAFINKNYGVVVGDKVLKEVGKRLTNIFRKRDIIGRTGDDEFSIMFTELKNKDNVLIVENKIKKAFNEPFFLDGVEVKVRINGGISVYPDDATEFLILYNNAVLALKEAKTNKQHFIKFFDQEMERRANDFFSVDALLEKAVKNNLFILHYQPYFNTKDLSVAGFEALARVKDEDGKIYFPNTFINVLENSHLLDRFTEWVLEESVLKGKKWGIPISVNISANTFKQREFSRKVLSHIKNVEKYLILEITERVFMDDIENCKNAIHELKVDSKIQIAIDDFGTGYSSLSYLKDLSADILKIDISFVRAMVEDKKSKALVESIIYIGKSLGMKTLAEGVETKEQFEMLQQFGVDYVQGYYLSKPVPEEGVDILLLSNPS